MRDLEKKLNYTFRNQALLEEALNHSSYANEHRAGGLRSNERLEFLGDSVLGFVTAEFLFCQHPDLPEGDLTRIRAALVCEQSLYEVAQKLGLGQYLKLGRGEEAGGGRERISILADATEAVFAAVYLDGGIEAASALIHRCLLDAEKELQDGSAGTGPAPGGSGAHLPHDRRGGAGPRQDLPGGGAAQRTAHRRRFRPQQERGRTGGGQGRAGDAGGDVNCLRPLHTNEQTGPERPVCFLLFSGLSGNMTGIFSLAVIYSSMYVRF